MLNQLILVASIVEKSVVRLTPAGILITTAILLHESKQEQAGNQRQIEFEISALAAGEIS